ncbi:hypothetical protein, partial [Crocinitomix algicola]|uniref:hypothetical protein n=1 Tax=Crocinitomix algicola TaxID=1740263 RepID=UPI001C2F496D
MKSSTQALCLTQSKTSQIFWEVFLFYESVENPFHKRYGNQKNIALRGTSKGFTLMVKQKIMGPALLDPSSTQSKMAQIFWAIFLFYESVENPFHKRCGNQKNIALRGTSKGFTLMVKQKIKGPALLDPSST